MMASVRTVGTLLRDWRQRRHMSQLDLAVEAEISTKHLSFVETGRSQPSREMVLHLADLLAVPLRDRNALLIAAGFAPVFPDRPLDDPALRAARQAVDLVLAGHEPYPALAVDRHWNLVSANRATHRLLVGVAPELLAPPVNVLRLSLHPGGFAPRIVNYLEWRSHLLARLERQIDNVGDPVLAELLKELTACPTPAGAKPGPSVHHLHNYAGVVVPYRLTTDYGVLSFFSTITVFGTPVDITLSELAIEAFFPADADTAETLRRMAEAG